MDNIIRLHVSIYIIHAATTNVSVTASVHKMSQGHNTRIPHTSIVDDRLSDTTLTSERHRSYAIVGAQYLSITNKMQVDKSVNGGSPKD